jgi:hypothetical protein
VALEVFEQHAAARTAAGDRAQVDAQLRRTAARARRGLRRRSVRRRGTRRVALDARQHGTRRDDRAGVADAFANLAGDRRRNLYRRFVGHHDHHRLIGGDRIAGTNEPLDDLGLGQTLADVGQPQLDQRGVVHAAARVRRAARTTSSTDGR